MNSFTKSKYRNYTCGELSSKNAGENVKLAGWIHNKRDHGGVLFIDLRDHYGITQLTVNNTSESVKIDEIAKIPNESVISIEGIVIKRSNDAINPNNKTGEIEVCIEKYTIESSSQLLPFQINNDDSVNENARLKYRFLDLRKEKIHNNIILRSKVIKFIRDKMYDMGFNEFQTPILTASSPEGARDFLVPSRVHKGKFYALPQAPQQFKQLLMVSGFDRYFQIAPCFRDEDARADRAPGEFYQLDLEMSFVEQNDVFQVVETLYNDLFKQFGTKKMAEFPFPRITYDESMLKYGSDKPDLRNPIENIDVTECFVGSKFKVFADAIAKNEVIRAIPAPKHNQSTEFFKTEMQNFAKSNGAQFGIAYLIFENNTVKPCPIRNAYKISKDSDEIYEAEFNTLIEKIKKAGNFKDGDAVFFACGKEGFANKIAGLVRTKVGEKLQLIDKNLYKFAWIVDFPYFEWNEDDKKIDFSHNPFSMPKNPEILFDENIDNDTLLQMKANQYDLVCNGIELSSGAIRNHKPEIMYAAFEICGYSKEMVDEKFSGMINAFKFGCPPHGGIAPGIDRTIMILTDSENIREIIAFPLNGSGEDLLMNAPSSVFQKQLDELGIIIKIDEKK